MKVKVCSHCGMARDETQVAICVILKNANKLDASFCRAEQDAKLAFQNFSLDLLKKQEAA